MTGFMLKRCAFTMIFFFYLVTHTLFLVMQDRALFMVISVHTLTSELANHP